MNKNERSCAIIVIARPGDTRVDEKEEEGVERCQELRGEIGETWSIEAIQVIPVVVGTLRSTSKKLKNCIEELGDTISTTLQQETALLWTAQILRMVLYCR